MRCNVPLLPLPSQVCSNLAVRPSGSGSAGAAAAASCKDPSAQLGRLVSSVILLRDVLRCLPVMADSMAWVDSELLKVGACTVCK
jgi:hypothetical protein